MVVVHQCPCGALSLRRAPCRARPRRRVMFVLAPDSSTKTTRRKSRERCSAIHASRRRLTSARSCSLARSVFFIAISQALERVVNCDSAATDTQRLAQLCKRGIWCLLNERVQFLHLSIVQCRGIVPARQWFGTATFTVAMQPSLKGRDVNAIELCHLRLRAFASLISLDGPSSNFAACDSHASIINKHILHFKLKMLYTEALKLPLPQSVGGHTDHGWSYPAISLIAGHDVSATVVTKRHGACVQLKMRSPSRGIGALRGEPRA